MKNENQNRKQQIDALPTPTFYGHLIVTDENDRRITATNAYWTPGYDTKAGACRAAQRFANRDGKVRYVSYTYSGKKSFAEYKLMAFQPKPKEIKANVEFGSVRTDPTTGWKAVSVFVNGDCSKVGEIVKDTGTHWQIRMFSDHKKLQDIRADHDFWNFLFDDFDGETVIEARQEIVSTFGDIKRGVK